MNKHVAPAVAPSPSLGCTCFRLRRASRRVTQYYDRFLEPSGLKVTQYSLLSSIRAHDQISITELAEALGMDRTTLTRNLKPLLDQGLVSVSEGADRRTRAIQITPEGEAAYRRAVPHWRAAQAKLVELLGHDHVADLHRLIDQTVERLG
jgi:DNA-binding MarR family transcriptional regulator